MSSWWNAEPGGLISDPAWDRRHITESAPLPCMDCGEDAQVSTVTHEGDGRSYCRGCAQARDRAGMLHDAFEFDNSRRERLRERLGVSGDVDE